MPSELLTKPTDKIAFCLREVDHRQNHYSLCSYDFFKGKFTYCALGAIAKDLGVSNIRMVLLSTATTTIADKLKITKEERKQRYNCPFCTKIPRRLRLFSMIIHLNDRHRKSYLEIANALEKMEKTDQKPVEPISYLIKKGIKHIAK